MSRLFLSFIAAISLSTSAFAESVQEMMSNCRAIEEAEVIGDKIAYSPSYPANHKSGECWGAFGVLQEMSRWTIDVKRPNERILGFCPPGGSRRTQFVGIFLEYARRNPARWHEHFADFAVESLVAAFPCKMG